MNAPPSLPMLRGAYRERRERLAVGLAVAGAAVASGIGVALISSISLSTWGYVLGLVGFFTVAPALIVRYARRRDALSPLPAVTGFFILEFAVGAIFYRRPRVDSVLGDLLFAYTTPTIGVALALAFGSWVLLVAGYLLGRWCLDGLVANIPRPHVNDVLTGTAVILLVVGCAARIVMLANGWYFHIVEATVAPGGLRNIVGVWANLPLIATAMVGARYYRERPSSAMVYWGLVLVEAAWAIPSGERSRLISLGLMIIVVHAYASPKRFPVGRTAVFAVVAVLAIFPLGVAYRSISGTPTGYQANPVGQLRAAGTQMAKAYSANPVEAVADGVDSTLRRFAGIASVAAIAHRGRADYPVKPDQALAHYGGALVPRALLPSKEDAGTITIEFGYRYGIVRPGAVSAVAVTSVGDLWGTFGLGGLAIGMLAIGGLMRALHVYVRERRENYAVLGIYAVALGTLLLGFESSIPAGLLEQLRALVIYFVVVGLAGGVVRLMRGHRDARELPVVRRPQAPRHGIPTD